MVMLVTRIQANELRRDEDMFDFIDANQSELRKFHEWRDHLRELLFKTGEKELCIGTNQQWERLKEGASHPSFKAYMSPFSFLLDQTQPWLIAIAYEKEGSAALHISEEFVERLAFVHPRVERLWKSRKRRLDALADSLQQP